VSNLITFGIIFLAAFLLQSVLALRQIKSFNSTFINLRKLGKVVTGKKSGRFIAGTVILFAINDDGNIIEGAMMQGVSVFAKIKPFTLFNGQSLITLDGNNENVKQLHTFKARAVENARELYIRYLTGTMESDKYSLFTPFGFNIFRAKEKYKNHKKKLKDKRSIKNGLDC
jgi:DNA-binding transcriptional regulator of glucitol operon